MTTLESDPVCSRPKRRAMMPLRLRRGGRRAGLTRNTDTMLHVEDVHKEYRIGPRAVPALCGVDLAIDEQGFYAVMGPSGSGKSTLLHLLAGLDKPDAGRICVDGDDLARMSERRLTSYRRRKIGIVFQQFNLIPTLTARQNIMLPGVIDRQPRQWAESRAGELLDLLGLRERADHRPDALSGGEQQRVAIARALLFKPSIVFADEPTGNLDSASSEVLWGLLRELADSQDITVLMVTHEPAAALHCRKVFVFRDGRCRGDFEVDDLDVSGVAARYRQLGW